MTTTRQHVPNLLLLWHHLVCLKAPFKLEPPKWPFYPMSLSTSSYMHEVFVYVLKPHFSVTVPFIKDPTRVKKKRQRNWKCSWITKIFSFPPAKDFLIVSVTQPRTRPHKGSTTDFGITPISCRYWHVHAFTTFSFLLYQYEKFFQ